MAMTYFALWMTRLMGLLPDLGHCTVCHESLRPGEITFNAYADGLFCAVHRHPNDSILSPDSWQVAQRMLRAPVAASADGGDAGAGDLLVRCYLRGPRSGSWLSQSKNALSRL